MDPSASIPLLISVVLLVIVVFSIVTKRRFKNNLLTQGKTTAAKIVEREHKKEARMNNGHASTVDVYTLHYEYNVDGSSYRRKENLSWKQFTDLAETEAVEVIYLPEKPNDARIRKFIDG